MLGSGPVGGRKPQGHVVLEAFENAPVIWVGSFASLLAGLATGLGALPVLFFVRSVSASTNAFLLGAGAGVMLAATSFSLIEPGFEGARRLGASPLGGALTLAAGMMIGALALLVGNRILPHQHFLKGVEGPRGRRLKQIWLFVLAITLHNFPEGLAVGVGFGGGDVSNGTTLALGIALQNLPEGLVVALALLEVGYDAKRAFLVALLTGLIEPIGGVLGVAAVTLATSLLPWGMAFAAGAMLFVISGEIIPESHRQGQDLSATTGVMVGFIVMMVLDLSLT